GLVVCGDRSSARFLILGVILIHSLVITVSAQTPTITELNSSSNPSSYGLSVTFRGVIDTAGTIPTGNLTIKEGAIVLGTVPVTAVAATNLLLQSNLYTG